jgi:gamma-glutamyltranspeptidase/glutathione hydrolase
MQVIVNVIDFEMNLQEAVDAPRIHHQWLPDRIVHEPFGIPADVERALAARGHTVFREAQIADSVRPYIGDCQAVMIEPGTGMRLGAADPRQAGRAMGY